MPQTLTATRQNATEMTTSPAIFWEGVRPSERPWATDSMSSSRPSEPVTSVTTTASTSAGVHWATSPQATSTPTRMMMPPIVGVPCFTRWRCGPSARICWPTPSWRMSRMKSGMSAQVTRAAMPMARNTW